VTDITDTADSVQPRTKPNPFYVGWPNEITKHIITKHMRLPASRSDAITTSCFVSLCSSFALASGLVPGTNTAAARLINYNRCLAAAFCCNAANLAHRAARRAN
jgi:hypothetical protein